MSAFRIRYRFAEMDARRCTLAGECAVPVESAVGSAVESGVERDFRPLPLLHRDALGQVPGFINVAFPKDSRMVRKKL